MRTTLTCASLVLPLALWAAPALAEPDLSGPEVESAVRFALPALFDGFRSTCSTELSPDGYVALNADRLAVKFAEDADAHWPEAKEIMFELGTDQGVDKEMLVEMPDDALKPFVTAILVQMAATKIEPAQCIDIERGLELIDPLPADNIAGLVGFLIEMASNDNNTADTIGAGQ